MKHKERLDVLLVEKGYFDSLKDGISNYIKKNTTEDAVIVDICCGEGYYSHKIKEETNREICGFDISKEMVKLAGKRKNGNLAKRKRRMVYQYAGCRPYGQGTRRRY